MTATINGITLEGTPDELAILIRTMGATSKPKRDKAVKREEFNAIAVDLTESEKSKALEVFHAKAAPKGINPFAFQKAARSGKATPAVRDYLRSIA